MTRPRFDPQPIVLESESVRLEPLTLAHAVDLLAAAQDESIWRYKARRMPRTLEDSQDWIGEAIAAFEQGTQLPFAIVHWASGRAIGSTRYLDIRREHRALEIGWTWIATEHQRTAVNTECKILLLSHAFEALGAQRVQLKTDARNLGSQRAIERLGARREGVLRRHVVLWDGFVRDSVYYSILDDEWPAIRRGLEERLARHR